MNRLIERVIPKLISKAYELIRLNDECCVEKCVDGTEISLNVDYKLYHGNPAPDGQDFSFDIYNITIRVDGDIIDETKFINKQMFY